MIGSKPLSIRFDKVDGFIWVYDRTRYLVLFGPEKYDAIYNRIRYLISQKSGITYISFHNYARIKIDSYNVLPLEETLPLHKVVILIKSVCNKNQNLYYYVFLEKWLYQSDKNNNNKYYTELSVCINYKCYITIELTFLKESMLIRQVNQKSVIFVNIVFFIK